MPSKGGREQLFFRGSCPLHVERKGGGKAVEKVGAFSSGNARLVQVKVKKNSSPAIEGSKLSSLLKVGEKGSFRKRGKKKKKRRDKA